ncbi:MULTISPECIES: hypothetical protein [Chitinophaga]|nr:MULTISPECIES: hypothetical protein [Chitinophaga]
MQQNQETVQPFFAQLLEAKSNSNQETAKLITWPWIDIPITE